MAQEPNHEDRHVVGMSTRHLVPKSFDGASEFLRTGSGVPLAQHLFW